VEEWPERATGGATWRHVRGRASPPSQRSGIAAPCLAPAEAPQTVNARAAQAAEAEPSASEVSLLPASPLAESLGSAATRSDRGHLSCRFVPAGPCRGSKCQLLVEHPQGQRASPPHR